MEYQPSRSTIDQSGYLSFRPGARLRTAREAQGLSLEQVAATLKVLPRILQALEADNYAALPEPVFVRGYLRQYAALVAVPADEVLARFDEYYQADGEATKHMAKPLEYVPVPDFVERPDRHKPKIKANAPSSIVMPKGKWKPIVITVLSLATLIVFWQWDMAHTIQQAWQQQRAAFKASTAKAASETIISLPNTVTAMPSMDTLDLRFTGDTQVLIRDASGKELTNASKKAGENLVLTGESPFSIELSQAAAVQFRLNDKTIDLKPYTVNGAVNFRLSR